MKQETTKRKTKKMSQKTKTIDEIKTVKLISNAGKIPRPPKELLLKIKRIENPNIIKFAEEVEKYRMETKRKRNAVMLRTDFCRLTI